MKRSFKYRFYPTDAQAVELSRTFGCVRKVYDPALAARAEAWKASGERMGFGQASAMLTAWKKTWEKRSQHPRFDSKRKSRACAEYTRSGFRSAEGSNNRIKARTRVAACGADARPHRESSSRSGRSVAKRESPRVSVGTPSC